MKRRKSEKDQELTDRNHLFRAWRRWHRERLEKALAGVHGAVLARLMAQLKNLSEARELVAAVAAEDWSVIDADIARVVQKWGKDNMPSEPPIILAPNQKYPDIKAMNEKCPKTEWRERFGKLEGPYQAQKIVYLWDPITMNKYSWPTSTTGGHICIAELVEKIQMMRRFKKHRVYAVVKLSSRLMSKRYNRQRPDLIVLRWVTLDGNTSLSATETPAITGPTTAVAKPATPQEVLDQFAGMKTVTPPTAKEATEDSIPF
jgi:hypothetical protein